MRLPAHLYQQWRRTDQAPAVEGWIQVDVDLAPAHTALVVMHAWDLAQPDVPGWARAVEYTPRARRILAEVFPPLLTAVRASPLPVFHVVTPGQLRASDDTGPAPVPGEPAAPPPRVRADPAYERLQALRRAVAHPGASNAADVTRAFRHLDFAPEARPLPGEGVAADGAQLLALCQAHDINHLIYVGFALNWCLWMSPGGMVDLARAGCLCSTIREAVTAVENRETAADQRELHQALWRVAVEFGFVFELAPFLRALSRTSS